MKDLKMTQIKLLKMKTIMPEVKSSFDGINNRLDITEENISKLEDKAIETIPKETQRNKAKEKNEESTNEL